MLHVAESCPSDTKIPPVQNLDPKYVPTQDLVESGWEKYASRLKARIDLKDLGVRESLKIAGGVTQVRTF